jgi:hypothetical protein
MTLRMDRLEKYKIYEHKIRHTIWQQWPMEEYTNRFYGINQKDAENTEYLGKDWISMWSQNWFDSYA